MRSSTIRRRPLLVALLILPLICLALAAVSALTNRSLPTRSPVVDRLTGVDKAHLLEATHLLASQGDTVFPGWGRADFAMMLFNEEFVFLAGEDNPASGWIKVPDTRARGGEWQPLEDERLFGSPVFYQRVEDPAGQIGAFTVKVGERWAASMDTYEYSRIGLVKELRADLPPFISAVFPLRLFPYGTFTSDWHIMALMHESFHAYQGIRAPQRLDAAELAKKNLDGEYPYNDQALNALVKREGEILAAAIKAETMDEKKALVSQFLDTRAARRAGLRDSIIDYERKREWLEGMAKYAELTLWQAASSTAYQPSEAASGDPGFKGYVTFRSQWSDSLSRLSRMHTQATEGRFYLSGFAQARLLDDLLPGWKERIMADGVWLEDLLAEAVSR